MSEHSATLEVPTEAVATRDSPLASEVIEKVVIGGDLSVLTPRQRLDYYTAVCRSLGLNPLTKPFEYLTLNGKLRLYALRDCTDQLRRLHRISIKLTRHELMHDLYLVVAQASTPDGRTDESTGVVAVSDKAGDDMANALMKAETKAKRRVTLSLAGLGWLDESEMDTLRAGPGDDEAHELGAAEVITPQGRRERLETRPTPAPSVAGAILATDLVWSPAEVQRMGSTDVNKALVHRLRYLAPERKEDRQGYIRLAFGDAAGVWSEVAALGLTVRKTGLLHLLALTKETPPPEDEDVPLGDEAEAHLERIRHEGQPPSDPPRWSVDATGFLPLAKVTELRQWATGLGVLGELETVLEPCPGYQAVPQVSEAVLEQAIAAVAFAYEARQARLSGAGVEREPGDEEDVP